MFKYICNLIQMTWKMGFLREQIHDLIFWNVKYVTKLICDARVKNKNIKTKMLNISFSNSCAISLSRITIT